MDTSLVRLAWTVITEGPAYGTEGLSLSDRIAQVLTEIDSRVILTPQERRQIQEYLSERQHLIQSVRTE